MSNILSVQPKNFWALTLPPRSVLPSMLSTICPSPNGFVSIKKSVTLIFGRFTMSFLLFSPPSIRPFLISRCRRPLPSQPSDGLHPCFFLNHGQPCECCLGGNFWPAFQTACWQNAHLISGLIDHRVNRPRGGIPEQAGLRSEPCECRFHRFLK